MHAGVPVFAWVIVILVWVICGLMLVAGVVGTILYFAGRPHSGVRRVGGAMGLVCGLFLGVLMVLGTVIAGYTSVRMESHEQQVRARNQAELQRLGEQLHQEAQAMPIAPRQMTPEPVADSGLTRLPEPDQGPAKTDAASSLPPHEDRTAASDSTSHRPAWTSTSETTLGDVTHIVLASKQYATVDEARSEVAAAATRLLVHDFEQIYGVPADSLRKLSVDTLKTTAVRQEYVETVDRDFGNFFAPMHRVWWQVELSPIVRTSLHPIWKGGVQEQRIYIVAGSMIAITVCLAGISLFSRRGRPAVKPTPVSENAAAVVLGVGVLTLFAQRCKRWWRSG